MNAYKQKALIAAFIIIGIQFGGCCRQVSIDNRTNHSLQVVKNGSDICRVKGEWVAPGQKIALCLWGEEEICIIDFKK